MTLPLIPVKFVIYLTQSGFDDLGSKDEFTLYFVRETSRFYQGDFSYNAVIQVDSLPSDEGAIPLKFYLVDGADVFLRTADSWIQLNNETADPGDGTPADADGITLNDKTIGGVKSRILETDVLRIPEDWQYIVKNSLSLEGTIINDGEIFID